MAICIGLVRIFRKLACATIRVGSAIFPITKKEEPKQFYVSEVKFLTVVGKTRTSSDEVDIVGSFPLVPNYYRTDDRSAETWYCSTILIRNLGVNRASLP